MEINTVKLVYFSPTGTTKKILDSIAQGMAAEKVECIDLTLPEKSHQKILSTLDDLVIIGAPVYGGRLPVVAVDRLKQLRAENTLVVLIVMYGNREFDDALIELKDLSIVLGFNPIAAGAFIGEHSFASEDIPIANGRPDDLDIEKAKSFGRQIKEKISTLASSKLPVDLQVDGRSPYEAEGARTLEAAPVSKEDLCTVCGTCVGVCPTAAISINGNVLTKVEDCIRCCACIKSCPEQARLMEDETMKHITNWLYENCSLRKEPKLFGVNEM